MACNEVWKLLAEWHLSTWAVGMEIQLAIEIDDDLDEDAQLDAAAEIFDDWKIREYPHAYNCTMVGLQHSNGTPVSDAEVRWSIPEYINTDNMQVE